MNVSAVPLASLCTRISSGGTPSRKHPEYFANSDGHPWVKSQELLDGSIRETLEHISDAGLANSSAKYYPAGTVLVAMYGANVGQLGLLCFPATVNQAICGLCVNPEMADGRYVFYALMQKRPALVAKAAGAAQQNLNQDGIRAFAIPLPALSTQRKIAAILSSYDDLIDNHTRRIKLLEEVAQATYSEWFVQFRYPGHENVQLTESQLGPIPEGWMIGTLGDLFALQRGFDLPTRERLPGKVPVLAATGQHGTHSVAAARGPGVVTGRSGSLGVVTYVGQDYWPLNTTLWTKELRHATAEFTYFILAGLDLKTFDSGAAVPTLNRNDIANLARVLPPAALITRFSIFARDIFSATSVLKAVSDKLRATRDLLLPRLISGEIDVEDLGIAMPDVAA